MHAQLSHCAEDSFLSKLSEAESELAALLVADGGSVSQAVLNLKRVFRAHHGIQMYPGGDDHTTLEATHDQPPGKHYEQDSLSTRTICLSTLHRALDCYQPERVPETTRELKRYLAATKKIGEMYGGRETKRQKELEAAIQASMSQSPTKAETKPVQHASIERLEQALDNALPPLPQPRNTHSLINSATLAKSVRVVTNMKARMNRSSVTATAMKGAVIDEDAEYEGGGLPGGGLVSQPSLARHMRKASFVSKKNSFLSSSTNARSSTSGSTSQRGSTVGNEDFDFPPQFNSTTSSSNPAVLSKQPSRVPSKRL